MSTYEFEVAAKNAVMETIRDLYHEDYAIEDISVVWMAHLLGFKKCVLVDHGKNARYYEVTYNKTANELYVDTYLKQDNRRFGPDELKLTP